MNFTIALILMFTKQFHGIEDVKDYYRIFYFIPLVSLGFRRIQDTGYCGFLFFIPLVNIFLAALPGDPKPNKYGMPRTL